MALVKWNPYRESNLLNTNLEHAFDDFDLFWPSRVSGTASGALAPAVDVNENKEGFRVEMELPGVAKEDVKVYVEDDVLTISGEKKAEKRTDEDCGLCGERRYGAFQRSFRLGTPVDVDRIQAEYKDGVLRLAIPKSEAAKPKTIQIK